MSNITIQKIILEECQISSPILKVLIINDNDTDLTLIQSFIKNTFDQSEIFITQSLSKARNYLIKNDFDLIIINYHSIEEPEIKNLFSLIRRIIIIMNESQDDSIVLESIRSNTLKYFNKNGNDNNLKEITKVILRHSYKENNLDKQKDYYLALQQKLAKNTELIVFSLDNEGPCLLYKSEKTIFSDFDIIKIQNVFYISIGQGNNYNLGLYELPVPMYPDYIAIIYSFLIPDKFNVDPRNEKTNYCLICYLMPKHARTFVHHMNIIEKLIKEQTTLFTDLNELKNPQNLITLIPRLYIF